MRQEIRYTWKTHEGLVLASVFITSGNRTTFVTGGNDNTIALWDTKHTASGASMNSTAPGKTHRGEIRAMTLTLSRASPGLTSTVCSIPNRVIESWLSGRLSKSGFMASIPVQELWSRNAAHQH